MQIKIHKINPIDKTLHENASYRKQYISEGCHDLHLSTGYLQYSHNAYHLYSHFPIINDNCHRINGIIIYISLRKLYWRTSRSSYCCHQKHNSSTLPRICLFPSAFPSILMIRVRHTGSGLMPKSVPLNVMCHSVHRYFPLIYCSFELPCPIINKLDDRQGRFIRSIGATGIGSFICMII